MNEVMIWFQKSEIWASVDASFTIISIVLTTFTLFFSFKNWKNNKKQKKLNLEKIRIYFEVNKNLEKEHRFEITRKDFTRAEIAGMLSFILKDSKIRYNIDYLVTQTFFDDIFKVQTNESSILIIKMNNEEEEKFKKIQV